MTASRWTNPKWLAGNLIMATVALSAPASAEVIILDNQKPAVEKISQALAARNVANQILTVQAAQARPAKEKDVWVLAHAETCNAEDVPPVISHLKSGGSLLLLGELPFQRLTYNLNGKRVEEGAFFENALKPSPLISVKTPEAAPFYRASNLPELPTRMSCVRQDIPTIQGKESRTVAHITVPRLTSWDTYNTTVTAAKPKNAVTTFWAKGGPNTRQLAVEWQERDGSRWIATVDLSSEWRFYALRPEDFPFFYDSPTKTRGQRGDKLHTQNALGFSFGLAFTHTRIGEGPHEYWIGDIGLASAEAGATLAKSVSIPQIDGLYPRQTAYPIHPAKVELGSGFRECALTASLAKLPIPQSAWSSYWRPMGSGFDKDRRMRFIPVVTALNADATRAGTLAQITLHLRGAWNGALYGTVSVEDDQLLLSNPWQDVIAQMLVRMQSRAFFAEAGSTEFTYDVRDMKPGGLRVGARLFEPQAAGTQVEMSIRDGQNLLWSQSAPITSATVQTVACNAKPEDVRHFEAKLVKDGQLLDVIRQEIGFDGPREHPAFLTAKDRKFFRNGQEWRAFGVNYMPTSGMAATDAEEFEMFIEDRSYDPEIVEHDLARIEQLGMNMISAFVYASSAEKANVLDLLRRARRHHLMVNLGLRPAAKPPLPPSRKVFEALIPAFRLAEKDEIMAYDIAWEPWWGREAQRAKFGHEWYQWVEKKYGSPQEACKAWDYTPRDLGSFPADEELDYEGPWKKASNDYRTFVDEFLNEAYGKAREEVRKLDPNHLVSFRQSEGANPKVTPSYYPIDLAGTCRALDFLSPEGYGIGDISEDTKSMIFAASYLEGLAPGKPIIWAEYGSSIWNGDAFTSQEVNLARQAQVVRGILENAERARAAGTVVWWFPGGYRSGENSDFGILNPDGTERPATAVLHSFAQRAKAPAQPVQWTPTIKVRRDDSVRGFSGLYERIGKQFQKQVTKDSIPLVISK